jgi:hypothetical protein
MMTHAASNPLINSWSAARTSSGVSIVCLDLCQACAVRLSNQLYGTLSLDKRQSSSARPSLGADNDEIWVAIHSRAAGSVGTPAAHVLFDNEQCSLP